MPPGAYITDHRRISPILHRPLPGRTLSSQVLANGEGRGADILRENCRFMRRDVDRAASLRTYPSIYALYGIICAQRRQSGNASAHDPISKDAVSDGLRNRFLAAARNDIRQRLGMTGRTVCTRLFADAPLDLHRRKEIRLECLLLLY